MYYKIKAALPPESDGYFEEQHPGKIEQRSSYTGNPVLAKIVLIDKELVRNHSFFSHQILMIRDPRDLVISALLYESGYHAIWNEPEETIRNHIQQLQQKEADKNAFSVRSLWKQMAGPSLSFNEFRKRLEYVRDLQEKAAVFPFYYEDLIQENFAELEQFIGYSLNDQTVVPKEHERVVRSKGSGNWRNWFTAEDVDFFHELFGDILEYFYPGKSSDWHLKEKEVIPAKQSSAYVLRLVNERRRLKGMPEINLPLAV